MNFHGSSIYSNLRIANNSDILQFENVLYTNCAICHIIEYYSAVKKRTIDPYLDESQKHYAESSQT